MHPREEQDQEERKRGEDERRKRKKERRKTRREESSDSGGSVASDPRDLDTNSKSTTIKSKTDSAENFNIKKGDKIVNKSSGDSGDNGETDIIDDAPYAYMTQQYLLQLNLRMKKMMIKNIILAQFLTLHHLIHHLLQHQVRTEADMEVAACLTFYPTDLTAKGRGYRMNWQIST